jgi:hypothetical protein
MRTADRALRDEIRDRPRRRKAKAPQRRRRALAIVPEASAEILSPLLGHGLRKVAPKLIMDSP